MERFPATLVGELGTSKLAKIFAYGKWLCLYIMLLHGTSDLDQRCLKTRNSEDKCTLGTYRYSDTRYSDTHYSDTRNSDTRYSDTCACCDFSKIHTLEHFIYKQSTVGLTLRLKAT